MSEVSFDSFCEMVLDHSKQTFSGKNFIPQAELWDGKAFSLAVLVVKDKWEMQESVMGLIKKTDALYYALILPVKGKVVEENKPFRAMLIVAYAKTGESASYSIPYTMDGNQVVWSEQQQAEDFASSTFPSAFGRHR